MESLVLNLTGKVRQVSEGGKTFLVAPVVMINPGVLPGSKGSLLYRPDDVRKSAPDWNGMPLLINHPHDPITNQPLSAQDPEHSAGILKKQGVGEVRKSRFENKKHRGEAWFDSEKLKRLSPEVHKRILAGKPVSVSTGLFTDNLDEPGSFNGRPYVGVATNFRPDHLAILDRDKGACDISDGCGILVNKKQTLVINPAWVEDHDIWEKAKAAADKGDYDDDSYYAVVTSIYKKMGGGIAPTTKNSASEVTMNKLQQLANNTFCPTGAGGGIDSSCGKGEGGKKHSDANGPIPMHDIKVPKSGKLSIDQATSAMKQMGYEPVKGSEKQSSDFSISREYKTSDGRTTRMNTKQVKDAVMTGARNYKEAPKDVAEKHAAKHATTNTKLLLLANSNPEGVNQYTGGGGKSKFDTDKEEADKVNLESVHTGAMLERLKQGKRVMNTHLIGKLVDIANSNPEGINQYSKGGSAHDEKGKFTNGNGGAKGGKGSGKVHGAAKEGHGGGPDLHQVGKLNAAVHRNLGIDEDYGKSIYSEKQLNLMNEGTNNMPSILQDKLTALLNSSVENADVKEGTSVAVLDGNGPTLEADAQARRAQDSAVASPLACPACGKLKVSQGDEAEEVNEDTLNCDEKMTKNQSTSVVENDNQVQQEGGPTMATVTLNAEEREAVVNGLIDGECCFEENEREVLNSLSDRTLARLTLNAKEMPKFIQDKIDAKAAKEEEETEEPEVEEEEEVENVDDQATEEKDRAGLGPRAGKGTGKNESQAMGKVKPMGGLNPKATNNQLSAEDRQFLAIGRKVIADRRGMLINTITANSRNPFDKKELAVMNLDQLEKLGQLAAVENEVKQPAFTMNRFASYMGSAAGAGIVNNDDGTDDDCLPLPVMNWKENAKV